MVVVEYWLHTDRLGMLSWRHDASGHLVALGGLEPKQIEPHPVGGMVTVVTTDQRTRVVSGWQHPDNLEEISGRDWAYLEVIEVEDHSAQSDLEAWCQVG